MRLKEAVKQLWIGKIERKYEKQLAARKAVYDSWVRDREKAPASDAQASYMLFLQKNGCLSEYAKSQIAVFFAEHPQVQIVYGDEDFLNGEGKRENPWYKPCWSPDTYLSKFYVGSVIAVRREVPENGEIIYFDHPDEIRPVLTSCIHENGGFERNCTTIARCPQVLFHVSDVRVWETYLLSSEPSEALEKDAHDISVIIPSKDNPDVLNKCVESLKEIGGLEIVIIDNGSNENNRSKIEAFAARINEDGCRQQRVKYLYRPMDFHFSRMCNMGAEEAEGKYLLLLNDDIEACGTDWIYAMRQKASGEYVGAVGLKLYYPGGIRIQHAGITNLPVGPVHKMQFAEDNKGIYFDRNRGAVNCLAVTGACLMIEKDKYVMAGGLKESLRVAYNDVDLGFVLYESGYQNVVLNDYYAYHHESLSRGNDETKEKMERLMREREQLYKLHPGLWGKDPYYPDGLSKDGLDSRIVPAYINALNQMQEGKIREAVLDMQHIRVDNCLFLGIEHSEYASVKGYGVVLGDNNACYDRYVVLAQEQQTEQLAGFVVKVRDAYRQDLEENMSDQRNVALCGFQLHFSEEEMVKLSKGIQYRIGVMAVHKINKGRLLNWSGRYFTI